MASKYSYENARYGHLPKHWDAEDKKVCIWRPPLQTEYPLDRLLGKYTIVALYNEDEPQWRLNPTDTEQYLVLGLRAGCIMADENVYGIFRASNGVRRGTFAGLTPFPVRTGPPRPTLRRFDLATSYENRIPREGHGLEVLDAVDNNGNNYVALKLEYFVKGSNCISYMAKKQPNEAERCMLTEDERRSLGITMTFEEVEEAARIAAP
ncbi:hypothetical protein MSAN_02068600 [Mycena sanguinolenta]|uniref:Uncharacterized protein n=1 Tax=Mycena sanguinolenta TaxID=230812 RepID=A0A8H6XII9_9AGAR|nr:hypothetical protein MSAN_02068600 [Mycena sanguinolenta]